MLRIVVADDMPMQVHMLQEHLNTVRPQDEVFTARNGKEILKLVQEHDIDLILSDIRMPQMDGLEMLRQVRRISRQTLVVFITAYAYFEYAQTALQQGAVDFLVKPIDDDELDQKLLDWEQRIVREKQERSSRLNEQETAALNRWLHHGFEVLRPDEKLLLDSTLSEGWIASVYVSSSQNADTVCAHLAGELHQILAHPARILALPTENHRRFLVLQGKKSMEHVLCEFFLTYTKQGNVRIGLSAYQPFLARTGSQAILMSRCALNTGFYRDQTFMLTSEIRHSPSPAFPPLKIMNSYVMAPRKEMQESIARMLDFLQKQQPNVAQLLETTMYYLAVIDEQLDPDKKDTGYLSECSQTMRNALGWSAYRSALLNGLEHLYAKAHVIDQQTSDPIRHCVSYIQSHYSAQLSLGAMAEMYFLSPNYFSALFKKKMGQGFVEYLTDVRLTKAAEKLRFSDDLIYKIAEDCGYLDARYFIRQFQKKYGMSPAQYRRLSPKEDI